MPGRWAKPLQLHVHQGNPSHLTKAEIEERSESEIKFGDHNFITPSRVKKNKIALKKWKEIISRYQDGEIDFVTTSDTGILERYCLTYAEYYNLQTIRDEIESKGWDIIKTYHAINELGLESDINKKLDLLVKMEDRLFLNPLAKIRNIPKQQKEKQESPLEKQGFGNV